MSDIPFGFHVFAWIWLALVAAYVVSRLVGLGASETRSRKRAAFVAEMRSSGALLLSCTFKMLAIVAPPIRHHVPWLWIVPLAFFVLTWPLKTAVKRARERRLSETAYSRSLRVRSRRARP